MNPKPSEIHYRREARLVGSLKAANVSDNQIDLRRLGELHLEILVLVPIKSPDFLTLKFKLAYATN